MSGHEPKRRGRPPGSKNKPPASAEITHPRTLEVWDMRAANVPMGAAEKIRGERRLQRLQDQANAWLAADLCSGKGEAPRFDCTTGMGAVVVIPGSVGSGFGADRGAWSFSN